MIEVEINAGSFDPLGVHRRLAVHFFDIDPCTPVAIAPEAITEIKIAAEKRMPGVSQRYSDRKSVV